MPKPSKLFKQNTIVLRDSMGEFSDDIIRSKTVMNDNKIAFVTRENGTIILDRRDEIPGNIIQFKGNRGNYDFTCTLA